jgi:uncharacterized protein (TIRG00374 family)
MNGQVLLSAQRPELASPATERRKYAKAAAVQGLLLAAGLAILAGLIWQIGPKQSLAYLRPLGWTIVFAFLPYFLVFVLDSLGWQYAFERPIAPDLARLIPIQIIGKAVNLLTPLVPVGGEPLKAHLLRTRGVPLTEGLASVVISRTVATIAQGVFVAAVTAFTLFALGLPDPLINAILVTMLAGGVLVGAFLLMQTRGLFTGLLGFMDRMKVKLPALEAGAGDVDRRIRGYYLNQRGRLSFALSFHFLSCLAEGLEVYVLLTLLALPRSPVLALGLAAFSSTVRAASFPIPGSLGVQEGGIVLLFVTLGPPPDTAIAFSILRRLREVFWSAAGLCLLGWYGSEQRGRLTLASFGTRQGKGAA